MPASFTAEQRARAGAINIAWHILSPHGGMPNLEQLLTLTIFILTGRVRRFEVKPRG